jgi:hypothetical protein
MSKLNRILFAIGIIALCMAAFSFGRYAERLKLAATGGSYRAFILEGMLWQLRSRQVPKVGLALEMRLDEEIAALAGTREQKLANRLFVSAENRNQVNVVLKRFVKYRNTAGVRYEGSPLWQIERFEDPSQELLNQLEKMNSQRSRINALVESVYQELGGREEAPPLSAPIRALKPGGKPAEAAAETPVTNNPAKTPAPPAPQP